MRLLTIALLSLAQMLMAETTTPCSPATNAITATRIAQEIRLDARHPAPEWAKATPVTFCADWQGRNPDPARQTEVRALWTPTHLYLRFVCRYRETLCLRGFEPEWPP